MLKLNEWKKLFLEAKLCSEEFIGCLETNQHSWLWGIMMPTTEWKNVKVYQSQTKGIWAKETFVECLSWLKAYEQSKGNLSSHALPPWALCSSVVNLLNVSRNVSLMF